MQNCDMEMMYATHRRILLLGSDFRSHISGDYEQAK
jgi:hypothetical protein